MSLEPTPIHSPIPAPDSTPSPPSTHSLPEFEVKRIVDEEKFRHRLRIELEKGEEKKIEPKFWTFLNSPFGLFLLSSVLLTGFARLYTDYKGAVEQAQVRRSEILKLATEFDYRLTQTEYLARELRKANLTTGTRQAYGIYIWRILVGDVMFQPSLPEFKSVTW